MPVLPHVYAFESVHFHAALDKSVCLLEHMWVCVLSAPCMSVYTFTPQAVR